MFYNYCNYFIIIISVEPRDKYIVRKFYKQHKAKIKAQYYPRLNSIDQNNYFLQDIIKGKERVSDSVLVNRTAVHVNRTAQVV